MSPLVSADFRLADTNRSGLGLHATVWLFALTLVYLNLIPLRVTWLPFDEWMQAARSMSWLNLSVARRADWIANLFMFVPFGFLLGSALGERVRGAVASLAVALLGAVIVIAMAFVIEALQILVPQRTVSLNDVLAAALGGCIGLAVWLGAGRRLWQLAHVAVQPSRHALLAGLSLYSLFYMLLSPFPYDFVVSLDELSRKVAGGKSAFLIASACMPGTRCAGQLAVEVGAVIPFGMALAVWLRWPPTLRTCFLAAGAGLVFSFLIEFVQFFTYSGMSQGVSLITRALGFAAGAAFAGWVQTRGLQSVQRSLRPWAIVGWLPYLGAVFLVTGFAGAYWGGFDSAAEQLGRLNFQPFYYHYFVPEQAAMASLLYTIALYVPVGAMMWPWYRPGSALASRAAVVAALVSLCMETLKLFALDLRPDPTNILIAAFAGWAGVRLLTWLAGAITGVTVVESTAKVAASFESSKRSTPSAGTDRSPGAGLRAQGAILSDGVSGDDVVKDLLVQTDEGSGSDSGTPPRRVNGTPKLSFAGLVLGLGLAVVALFAASTHPLSSILAPVAVVLVVALVFRWPWLWLVLVPATLPVLDLRPWTGRLYFDEWDLLVVTVLSALWLARGLGRIGLARSRLLPSGRLWLVLYLVSYFIAVGMALWPLAWPEVFAFSSLHSDLNALRLAKGVLWALLLWPFFDAVAGDRKKAFNWFAVGMILGLAGAVASVVWERVAFTGLFDYSQHYRVVGFFSDTHTGGAFLEGYLVAAVPFLAAVLLWRRRGFWWPVAGVLFVGATYSVAVTFARAGYAGLAVAVLIVVIALVWRFGASPRVRLATVAGVLAVVGLGSILLLQVQGDEFMSQRVGSEQIERDWNIRVDHWQEILAPAFRDTVATWVGLGVGRFPEINYWEKVANGQEVPAIYQLDRAPSGDVVLNLMPGLMTYHWQPVSIEPSANYQVRVSARSSGERINIGLLLCEQWLIYSRRCVWRNQRVEPGENFQTLEVDMRSRAPITDIGWLQRPVKFVFYHSRGGDVLQVESISLVNEDGRELLANGDFSNGLERWFFASDDHLAWHVKHMWGQVFFEQGLVGLLLWNLLLVAAVWAAVQRLGRGGDEAWPSAIVLASLIAFLSVGLFDSLLDAPRLATLFYLLLLLALSESRPMTARA